MTASDEAPDRDELIELGIAKALRQGGVPARLIGLDRDWVFPNGPGDDLLAYAEGFKANVYKVTGRDAGLGFRTSRRELAAFLVERLAQAVPRGNSVMWLTPDFLQKQTLSKNPDDPYFESNVREVSLLVIEVEFEMTAFQEELVYNLHAYREDESLPTILVVDPTWVLSPRMAKLFTKLLHFK